MKPCQAIKANGKPCKARGIVDGKYCHLHSPEREQQRKEIAAKAGHVTKSLPQATRGIRTAQDYYEYLSQLLTAVAQGRAKPTDVQLKTFRALGNLFLKANSEANIERVLQQEEDKKN